MTAKDDFSSGSCTLSSLPAVTLKMLDLPCAGLILCLLLLSPTWTLAQVQHTKPLPAASAATHNKSPAAKMALVSKPAWAELTPAQQEVLKPLAATWNTISEPQKRKWLEISKNYHALTPEGQATMHSRMNEWAALSPQQRTEARLNFAKTKELSKQLTPEEKKAKWQSYQALSAEEKQKLAAKANTRPPGAATAVKPVSPQKLATVPSRGTQPTSKVMPAPAAAKPALASSNAAATEVAPLPTQH